VLTSEQRHHQKEALLARQREIETQFAQTLEMAQPVSPDPAIGRLTRQDAMQQQQMTLETRRRLELQRTQIQTALQRMEKGAYGICVMCKKPISEQRLEIVPESPLCVPCLEQRNRSKGVR